MDADDGSGFHSDSQLCGPFLESCPLKAFQTDAFMKVLEKWEGCRWRENTAWIDPNDVEKFSFDCSGNTRCPGPKQ